MTDLVTMSMSDQANHYLKTKVLSASPAELRLMLIDGAIRFATQAKEGLEREDFETSYSGFQQCRAIVTELITSVKPTPDPELYDRVVAIYTFIFQELIESSMEKDPARVSKVIDLLQYERETWVMLMEKVASESGVKPQAPAPVTTGYANPQGGGLSLSA